MMKLRLCAVRGLMIVGLERQRFFIYAQSFCVADYLVISRFSLSRLGSIAMASE